MSWKLFFILVAAAAVATNAQNSTAPGTNGPAAPSAVSSAAPTSTSAMAASSSPAPTYNSFNNCSFYDNFLFTGEHAVTLNRGGNIFTTVFWDADSWDVRSDSAFGSVVGTIEGNILDTYGSPRGYGSHEDVRRAQTSDPTDGKLNNKVNVVGGDFAPGMGVLQVDYETTASARLRNPLIVSNDQPGIVEFYTSFYVTRAHFWQVVFTPASNPVTGAEFTTTPSVFDSDCRDEGQLTCPPGPGLRPAEDSLNIVAIGTSDRGCNESSWFTQFLLQKTVNGNKVESTLPVDMTNPRPSYLYPTQPQNTTVLVRVQIRLYSSRVEIWAAINSTLTLIQSHPTMTVPWTEVNVHLVGNAFEAEKRPVVACWASKIRELYWRNVKAYPLKYSRTAVWPKSAMEAKTAGLTGFDIRSFDYSGVEPYNNRINVNENKYRFDNCSNKCYAYCSGYDWCQANRVSEGSTVDLPFQVPATSNGQQIVAVKLIYDIRNYRCSEIPSLGLLIGDGSNSNNNGNTSSGNNSTSSNSTVPVNGTVPAGSAPWTSNADFYRLLPNGSGWKSNGLLYHGNVECSVLNKTGNVSVAFNDNNYTPLPGGETIKYYLASGTAGEQWVERSIDVPLSKINMNAGASNVFRLKFEGQALIDRIHFEYSFSCSGETTTPHTVPVSLISTVPVPTASGTATKTATVSPTMATTSVPRRTNTTDNSNNSNGNSSAFALSVSNALVALFTLAAVFAGLRF